MDYEAQIEDDYDISEYHDSATPYPTGLPSFIGFHALVPCLKFFNAFGKV